MSVLFRSYFKYGYYFMGYKMNNCLVFSSWVCDGNNNVNSVEKNVVINEVIN